MAIVKVHLQPNESIEDAKDDLAKALTLSVPEAQHENDKFHDPVAEDMLGQMLFLHDKVLNDIHLEIAQILHSSEDATLTKGKALPIGTQRVWGGVKYEKHAEGWVPVKASGGESKRVCK